MSYILPRKCEETYAVLLMNVSQKGGCGVNDGTVVATYPHDSFSFSTFLPNYVTLAFIRQVSVDGLLALVCEL